MHPRILRTLSFLCLTAILSTGCASGGLGKREAGALGGGALGAGAGAIIGHQTGHAGAGAAIGGALGVLGGAVVGDQMQAQDQRGTAQDEEMARQRAEIEALKRERNRNDDYERY